MKKTAILIGAALFATQGMQAQEKNNRTQSNLKPEIFQPDVHTSKKSVSSRTHQPENTASLTTFWSEDFANGIPSSWT